MNLKTYLFASVLVSFMSVGVATSQESSESITPEAASQKDIADKKRVLGTVNVTGSRGAPAPKTGRLIMAVDVVAKRKRIRTGAGIRGHKQSRAASTVQTYGLSMRSVSFTPEGEPYITPAGPEPTIFEYEGNDTENQFIAFDLAPGYYVLSNIRFDITTLDNSDIDPFTGDFLSGTSSPSLSSSFRSSRDSVNYCINEKTVIFEVVEGQTSYFGYMQLSEPPANRSRQRNHIPIVGFNQSTEVMRTHSRWDERTVSEIYETPIKALSFDAGGETCQIQNAHRVPGWESASTNRESKIG